MTEKKGHLHNLVVCSECGAPLEGYAASRGWHRIGDEQRHTCMAPGAASDAPPPVPEWRENVDLRNALVDAHVEVGSRDMENGIAIGYLLGCGWAASAPEFFDSAMRIANTLTERRTVRVTIIHGFRSHFAVRYSEVTGREYPVGWIEIPVSGLRHLNGFEPEERDGYRVAYRYDSDTADLELIQSENGWVSGWQYNSRRYRDAIRGCTYNIKYEKRSLCVGDVVDVDGSAHVVGQDDFHELTEQQRTEVFEAATAAGPEPTAEVDIAP